MDAETKRHLKTLGWLAYGFGMIFMVVVLAGWI